MVDTQQTDTPISLDTTPTEQPISLDTGDNQNYLLSPTLISQRAERYAYAVSGTPAEKSKAAVQEALTQNQEPNLRQDVASTLNSDQSNKRYDLITKGLAAKQGPLTPEDMTAIDTASGYSFPYKYPVDPNSIFEVKYGKQFVSELDNYATQLSDSNFWNYGQMTARNSIEAAKIFGDVTTARYQYLLTKLQDGSARIDAQTPVGRALDTLKGFSSIYNEIKLRGNVPGVEDTSITLGGSLESQSEKLFNMPFEQFTATIDKVYNKLSHDNPQAAVAWINAMMGQSTTDKVLNNLNTAILPFEVGGIFKIGKVVYNGATLRSQVEQALKTATKAASTPEATIADLKASAGDLRNSAIFDGSNLLTGRVMGSMSPTEEAFKTLPTNFNVMVNDIQASDLAIPLKNKLLEQTQGSIESKLSVLAHTIRPTELNLEGVAPEILDNISKTVPARYPGINNAIIKQSKPTLNPLTKLYEVSLWWGKDGGLFFDNAHEAADATMAHGIRVTYSPELLAELDARIASIRSELGAPNAEFKALEKENQRLGKVHDNLVSNAEGIGEQYGRDSTAYSEAVAKSEAARGDLRESNRKLFAARKTALEAGTNAQEADVHGLNYHDTLPSTLRYLEEKRAAVTKKGGATVRQQGDGFYVEKVDNLDYRSRAIIDHVANPENPMAVSPRSWTSYIPYFNHFRTSEDTFSREASAARKAAITPQSVFLASVKDEGQIMSDFIRGKTRYDPVTGELNPFWKKGIPGVRGFINRGRLKNFIRTLDYSQTEALDPNTKIPGYYMTPNELKDFYLRTFNRPPSFDEVEAYEAVKRWDESQRVFTQIMVFRGQARRGNEVHQLIFRLPDGSKGTSPEFVAKRRNTFPRGGGTILLMGKDLASSSVETFNEDQIVKGAVKSLRRASEKAKEGWSELMQKGYTLLELDDHMEMPFKDLGIKDGNSLIDYVLTPNVESSSLKWDSLPRTGGGRHVYDYGLYIKQPKMKFENIGGTRISNYMGDQTIAPIAYRPLGEDVTKKMNQVRRLIDSGDEEGAKAAYIHNGLEGALEPWNKFRSKFEGFKDAEGTWHEPIYNTKEDFRVVTKGHSIVDVDKALANKYGPDASDRRLRGTWRDATRENSPAGNYKIQFTGERDAENLQSIENIGTYKNPIYNKTPAKMVSPLAMLNRGMRGTVNSLFMDDYKNYAVTAWLKEAMNHLKEKPSVIWSSPFGTFRNITRDSFLSDTKQEIVNALMANHWKIDQLVGTPTVMDTFVHSVAQDLADAAYKTLGPSKASYVVPQWLMPKIRDPFAFIRSVTFNTYLGMFSIPQLWVQSMTYVNMFAISPKYASQGTLGAYFHMLASVNKNPEILAHLDNMASKMGWKPGELTEAKIALENSGWKNVGGEMANFDNMHRANIIKSGTDSFLEMGRKPFQWGEKSSRVGSWYTAFKEFRDANPTGKLSDADIARIVDRADLFYGNMTVASHSMINSGVFALPTQFYMYALRLGEMFWSNSRLGGTLAERNMARMRLLAVNAAAFGLPMAAGVTGLPVTDWLRQHLLDNGYFGLTPPYVVGKNFTESAINEGLPATALFMATGHHYNVGPRGGLQGLTNMRDTMSQDASFWKVMGGASASLSLNTWNNGLYPVLFQLFHGNYKDLRVEDVLDIFKEAPVVNGAWSWGMALNTGKWINKNSQFISPTSMANATGMFLSGLRETNQSDLYNMQNASKARADSQKFAIKEFTKNVNRAMLADASNDPTNAQAFMRKALRWLPATDFPPSKLGHAIAQAFKGSESLVARTRFQFYIKDPYIPLKQREQLQKAYEWQLQHESQ